MLKIIATILETLSWYLKNMNDVTVTLTTCNRVDLLEKTIQSFQDTNTYPINEYIIVNDDLTYKKDVDSIFKHFKNCTVIHNPNNIGQKKSLDIAFSSAKNEYIFHLEDDWFFDSANSYVQNSLHILVNFQDIHQVWVRHEYDTPHKTKPGELSYNEIQFKEVDNNYAGCWNGYSWNPGLRRKSDYLKMFPNGISQFKDELQCALHTRNFNYKAVMLQPTSCYHIGYDRSTYSA
jgi:hypothetical protein